MTEIKEGSVDMRSIKEQFPLLCSKDNESALSYLDSAATCQKPQSVIDAVTHYYQAENANVHRGIYRLSEWATTKYEASRQSVKQFIHAQHNHEIVFTRGATEAINLVAHCYGQINLKPGDEIIISAMEHHANIVPWQMLCERQQATLKVIPMLDDGSLDLCAYENLLNEKTKMVALTHVSNVLGVVNPIKQMIASAHQFNVPVLIDAAQSLPHLTVDVQDLDCDFLVFSSHKMYGPTGVGVLYAKERWLEAMPPYQFGGDMIKTVSFEKTEFNVLPHKFEAGTPNMAGVIGLAEAIRFMNDCGIANIQQHEKALFSYAHAQLASVPGLTPLCVQPHSAAVISFTMQQAHPHDIATVLDQHHVAVRAGHHCAMPLMLRLGVPATARVSLAVYTSQSDIDQCVNALHHVTNIFK